MYSCDEKAEFSTAITSNVFSDSFSAQETFLLIINVE